MRVLVTNDDGIDSPGLTVLAEAALARGADVVVAAPDRESSGASASLVGTERDGRLVVERRSPPGLSPDVASFAVRASPGLITFVAAYGGFGPKPDLVLSGVNRGANTGHAVLHSGTVGAALAASTHDIPGLAVSLADAEPSHWDTAAALLGPVLDWFAGSGIRDRAASLNVPDVPLEEVRGLRRAPLAAVGVVQGRVRQVDHGHLRLTYADVEPNLEAHTDAGLLARGYATLTLLRAPVADDGVDLPQFDGPPLTVGRTAP